MLALFAVSHAKRGNSAQMQAAQFALDVPSGIFKRVKERRRVSRAKQGSCRR
jgi:hypothetical protein